jgi:hypothetical protein
MIMPIQAAVWSRYLREKTCVYYDVWQKA